jgi:hypothetical protein
MGGTEFDIDRVQEETNVSENVASLVSGRIEMLPLTTRKLLEYAACLGFCFATEHFVGLGLIELNRDECLETADAEIVGDDDECIESDMDHVKRIELVLSACLAEGLLEFATETHVKFAHDQIHHAILTSIPPETKPHIHLRIGKYLLGTDLDIAPVSRGIVFLGRGPVFAFSRNHLRRRGCGRSLQSEPSGREARRCQMRVCTRGGVSSSGCKHGVKG